MQEIEPSYADKDGRCVVCPTASAGCAECANLNGACTRCGPNMALVEGVCQPCDDINCEACDGNTDVCSK